MDYHTAEQFKQLRKEIRGYDQLINNHMVNMEEQRLYVREYILLREDAERRMEELKEKQQRTNSDIMRSIIKSFYCGGK